MTSSSDPSSTEPWLISVKTLGGFFKDDDDSGDGETRPSDEKGEKQFTVSVSPEDGLASLQDKIEASTGLKASQQRLIYRGRIISTHDENKEDDSSDDDNNNNDEASPKNDGTGKPKIKDIAGLSDGQTIHLVKKRESETPSSNSNSNENSTSPLNQSETSATGRTSLSNDLFSGSSGIGSGGGGGPGGGGSGSLLAALLGLSSMSDESEERDTTRQRWGWRSSRGGRSRRPHYRLTADDLEVPDPGSMEPVRQGLMTLHTLLPHADLTEGNSPLEANRVFYRGQWIDCRDTVNQWLEATVVEIMDPDDILPPRSNNTGPSSSSNNIISRDNRRRAPRVSSDPAVGANDFDARQRLLLEACESGDSDEEGGELAGFRRRDNNEGVQLLLIHYNGWPHRWDEWIRSDSERIRPFRTRTRHPVAAITSPTPQSIYNEAPRTNIVDGDEADDRSALLPELSRAIDQVNGMLQQVVRSSNPGAESDATSTATTTSSDLPWVYQAPRSANDDDSTIPDLEESLAATTGNIVVPIETTEEEETASPSALDAQQGQNPVYNRRELQNLATLLDRLGRTLSDAAPHVAALAQSLPEPTEATPVPNEEQEVGLLGNPPSDVDVQNQPPLGGLLGLWSRERRRNSNQNSTTPEAQAVVVDPDHVDYVSGLVNTSRGEVRSGPRSRSQNDDVSNLLGAYLAAASLSSIVGADDGDNNDEGGGSTGLGRLLSTTRGGAGGGGGNGGIDIHIHAVVTAPGVTPGGIGIGTLGGGGGGGGGGDGGTTTGTAIGTRNLFSTTPRERSNRASSSILRNRSAAAAITPSTSNDDDDEETLGLFSELYSENPEPVNPNGTPDPSPRRSSRPDVSRAGRNNDDNNEFARRISTPDQLNDLLNDAYGISPGRRSSRGTSMPRPSRQSSERSERRGTGWGRLFRRRRSERDRRNDP